MWEKKKLLIKSNFFFSHNVFKSCPFLTRQNEYLWSKGLKHMFTIKRAAYTIQGDNSQCLFARIMPPFRQIFFTVQHLYLGVEPACGSLVSTWNFQVNLTLKASFTNTIVFADIVGQDQAAENVQPGL